jgi:uncharacterized protein
MIPRETDLTLRSAGAVFWLLLLLAVGVGGMRALSGMPLLVSLLVPPDLIAARADSGPPAVHQALYERFPDSPYAPQWLTPVERQGRPDWLVARIRAGQGGEALAAETKSAPVIAIVIDDLGDDVAATRRAIALPKAVSLSFLPYPETTPELARIAAREGHQILVHVPMEPDGTADPGPNALLTTLPKAELLRRLDWGLARVPAFAGINNHEGSRFTADRAALVPVMETLADRHVFFLDSRTTPSSEVVTTARAFGVPSAGRDVFLDDVQTPQAIAAALALTEVLAKRDGVAIAIGHPHSATMDALAAWSAHRGDLVPVSLAIRVKTERALDAAER